jgi:hypothetical protein
MLDSFPDAEERRGSRRLEECEHDLVALCKRIAMLVTEECIEPATQNPCLVVVVVNKAIPEAKFSMTQCSRATPSRARSLALHQASPDGVEPLDTEGEDAVRITVSAEDGAMLHMNFIEARRRSRLTMC